MPTVDVWFDPSCPFTWRTTRWLVGVEEPLGLQVQWHLMSLAILNEGKDIPAKYREGMDRGRVAVRFLEAVRVKHGNQALARVYTGIGRRLHDDGLPHDESVFAAALAEAGLPEDLAAAGADESLQPDVAQSHAEGQQKVGQESGSPILSIDGGPGFFGPVVVPIPQGDDATRLFEAVALLSAVPAFSELKRARASF